MATRMPASSRPHNGEDGAPVLSTRALNRALLARQLLLRRHQLGVLDAVTRLVGLQAQAPNPPYIGLWTRLDGFAIEDLAGALQDRSLTRIAVMRSTVHLVTAQDCRTLRPLTHRPWTAICGWAAGPARRWTGWWTRPNWPPPHAPRWPVRR
ncbi:crosslink repair DNA glycosylase YcaQ family protein [Streptomyces sp. MS1.AVA.3]